MASPKILARQTQKEGAVEVKGARKGASSTSSSAWASEVPTWQAAVTHPDSVSCHLRTTLYSVRSTFTLLPAASSQQPQLQGLSLYSSKLKAYDTLHCHS